MSAHNQIGATNVTVPLPEAYVLPKAIINDRRKNKEKKNIEKDTINSMSKFILEDPDRRNILFNI
jgi:hypothetical protein